MAKAEKNRAAAYIRVSTEDQAEYSPDSQLKKISEYAEKNGYRLLNEHVYADEGISGKSIKKRENFKKMIAAAKRTPRPFDVILVWKFSRFARSREDSIVYKSMLRKELGIRVISVSEDVGDDKMSVIFEAMIEAMDEYYSVNLAEEVKRGMIEKISRGEPCAAAPFGYEIINKRYRILPDEAEIVRNVFEHFLSGSGMTDIARRLNGLGIRTHRGGKIENRTVEYWLNNPVYVGKLRWNPCGKTGRYHWHDSEIMLIDGEHEPIIPQDVWEAVQRKLSKKSRERKKYEKETVSSSLVGIMRCGVCGGAMVNCGGYFYCNNKNKGTCRGNGGINAGKLERALGEYIKMFEEYTGTQAHFSKKINSVNSALCSEQLKKNEKKLERIREAYESGAYTLEEYLASRARINAEAENIKKCGCDSDGQEIAEKSLYEILLSDTASARRKNDAMKAVFNKIVKSGDGKFELYFN